MEIEEKPITYVVTYRGVDGFSKGYHEGFERNVIITGAEVSGLEESWRTGETFGGQLTATSEQVKFAYESAENERKSFANRIDRCYFYLGANGAGPAFEYIKNMVEQGMKTNVVLVACDCSKNKKQEFAKENELSIIWSDCGGRDTLRKIVENELNEGDKLVGYAEHEKKLIKNYFEKKGEKLLGREEKLEMYGAMDSRQRNQNKLGIENAIFARLSRDNADIFDGENDGWKLKMLWENLDLILEIEKKNE
ncbi:hypothetical protein HOK51_06890 [Candidatus Woesearchaeota archaeon]|jgi:hypothetical protein|nr:hypothetical protein [Candidatus Woesearchaeota archaeon]MBT6519549.1 hypothetical protein [Candidatus Woesearchaeota archaeon]MBT7367706.1 hypothetical protein [Candidatus Woesearchaeota archaeon]